MCAATARTQSDGELLGRGGVPLDPATGLPFGAAGPQQQSQVLPAAAVLQAQRAGIVLNEQGVQIDPVTRRPVDHHAPQPSPPLGSAPPQQPGIPDALMLQAQRAGIALNEQGVQIDPITRRPVDLRAPAQPSPPLANAIPTGMLGAPRATVQAVPLTAPIVAYVSDPATWAARFFDAEALLWLLHMALQAPEPAGDGFTVRVSPEEYAGLSPDLRLHFMAVRRDRAA